MKLFGLIGYPLSYSFSEKIFSDLFREKHLTDHAFRLFPLSNLDALPSLIATSPTLMGLNVTIPYKESVLDYLDLLDETAGQIGAVNTISIIRNGEKTVLAGHNTDGHGFYEATKGFHLTSFRQALILGTGGAAKAVAYVLQKEKMSVTFVSRHPHAVDHLAYDQLTETVVMRHRLIVNATPVGMYPDVEQFPDIPYHYLTPQHLAFDLNYNPEETVFLKNCRERGVKCMGGYKMLQLQARKACEIWSGAE
jgi:shikimate dehydrogenase